MAPFAPPWLRLWLQIGLPDVFSKNTGLFVNSDKNLIIEKITKIWRRPGCSYYWILRIQTEPIHIYAMVIVTMIEVKLYLRD